MAANEWGDTPANANEFGDTAAPDATIGREAGILARGAYPTVAGATLGAGIGSLAGPPGTAIGGLVGGVAVPVAEAVNTLYNLGAKPLGLPTVGSPTKAVEDLLTKMGLPQPATTTERAVEAAGSALGNVGTSIPAAASLGANATTPVARGVGAAMAQQPTVQAVTAPIAAATNQAVTEKTDSPVLGFLSSLMVGGAPALVTGKVQPSTTRADIEAQAKAHYATMENSGLNVSPESFGAWLDSLPGKIKGWGKFAPTEGSETAKLINIAKGVAKTGAPISIADLDQLHHNINGAYSIANTNFDNASLTQMKAALNDYVHNLKPDDLTGTLKPGQGESAPANWYYWRTANADKLKEATGALDQARQLWRANAKMRDIEQIVNVAEDSDDPDLYIRQQFRRIRRNEDQFNNYTPDERKLIVQISKQGTLGQVGRAAPHFTPAGMVKGTILTHAGPAGIAGGAAAYGAFKGAQSLRNARIQALSNMIAGQPNPRWFDNTALQTAPLTAARAFTSNPLGLGASRAEALYGPPHYTPPDNPDDEYARNP